MSPADAATITPNAASSGIATPMCTESSAAQSAAASAIAAVSSAAALANSAKRSWMTAPPKYVVRAAPAHSSMAKATSTTPAAT